MAGLEVTGSYLLTYLLTYSLTHLLTYIETPARPSRPPQVTGSRRACSTFEPISTGELASRITQLRNFRSMTATERSHWQEMLDFARDQAGLPYNPLPEELLQVISNAVNHTRPARAET